MKKPLQILLRQVCFAVAVCALSACATGRLQESPQPAAPPDWQAALPHGGRTDDLRQWWSQFNDPLLGELITQAERNSPTLTQAWATIEKARATLRSTKADALPSLNAGASVSRSNPLQSGAGTASGTSRSAGLDASWEIDLFGKVRRNAQASSARVDARTADWHDARVSLSAEVADTVVQIRACKLLTDAYGRDVASTEATEKATARAVQAGMTAPAEGSLARASLASATSSWVQQGAQCELVFKSLVYLTGIDEPSLRRRMAPGEGSVPEPAAIEVKTVPAQVLRQRPDLASLEREVAAAGAEIGAAQADLYPSLSLSGSISVSASSLASPATLWSFGPSLSIPLFDGDRRHAAVDSARASYTSAWAGYQQGVRAAVREVEEALVNLDSAARRAEQAASAATEYRRYFNATETQWRAGRVSQLTLEEARRLALTAEITQTSLQGSRVRSWIALYKALGGGWQPGENALSPDALSAQKTNTP